MEKNLQELVDDMNEMLSKGQLVSAAEKYYAPNIRTIEFDGRITAGREAAMKKLTDFVAAIRQVKAITMLPAAARANVSFSEYILDLEMKDGSKVYLHEVVRSLWDKGQVVEERYFKG